MTILAAPTSDSFVTRLFSGSMLGVVILVLTGCSETSNSGTTQTDSTPSTGQTATAEPAPPAETKTGTVNETVAETQLNNQSSGSNEDPTKNMPLPEVEQGMKASLRAWVGIEDFPIDLALFDTVFWDPRDTISLRDMLREGPLVKDKTVMEIGTGSGLISLCCLKAGASKVIATDVNPSAVACARYNAQRLGFDDRFEVRRVPLSDSGAFTIIQDDEKFDFIITNPPWEDDKPKTIDEYALYDPGFKLLDSLLLDAKAHLSEDGQLLLAYGCVTAIKTIFELSDKRGYDYEVLDSRELDDLAEVFLPGMLIRLTPKKEVPKQATPQLNAPQLNAPQLNASQLNAPEQVETEQNATKREDAKPAPDHEPK